MTQDVWCFFLIYLCFSRFATIKLGKDDEKPTYDNFTWFCMIFTCGVAVGLYVFGVGEPLYFYRSPWYAHTKVNVDNDSQRAQQAIFMAVYHWGIHGWVPYILLALLVGLVSYRWGLPMTIRSCFYPLLGDHATGFFGDLIDAISISTTTFGVCTSLGLGVPQLTGGLQFVSNIGCDVKDNCRNAGGTWNLETYGKETCTDLPAGVTYNDCKVGFLATADDRTNSGYVAISIITLLATVSVISGLDNGIKKLAYLAFSCGWLVMLIALYADNTFYILNIMVQTIGYYLQYIIQVGFDCEAFQQQNFEWTTSNRYWGSSGSESVLGKLTAVGLNPVTSSSDCGDAVNRCLMGTISLAAALASSASAPAAAANARATLLSMKMSPASINNAETIAGAMGALYPQMRGVPCGSGWNSTHADAFLSETLGITHKQPLCSNAVGAAVDTCANLWAGSLYTSTHPDTYGPNGFPLCPESTTKTVANWGTCASFASTCPTTASYFDDTNPNFMDWWTIFYWAWWITWAPFVGFFVAKISRGRTVREVIIGGFFAPTLFALIWFSVFGGLAIKMERTAEIALQVRPDIQHASVTCSEHYDGGMPITPEAKKLAEAGYFMITCLPFNDQIYQVMMPYKNLTGFIHLFLWFGLVIYFLTSSDSGSMTDDIISAGGLDEFSIPIWQKVFWCWTEGVVAIALLSEGRATLGALRSLSIIIGLPFTVLLCMMVPSLWRILKKEIGDEDILTARKFNTQLLDFMEMFKPRTPSPLPPMEHMKHIGIAFLVPFLPVKTILDHLYPTAKIYSMVVAVIAQVLFLAFIIFHACEASTLHMHTLAWVWNFFFVSLIAVCRQLMRQKHNVWGSFADDFFVSMFAYPLTLAQMAMMAETDGKDAPLYFAESDEVIAEMAAITGDGLPVKMAEVQIERAQA